jgi:hypothetical protein
MPRAIGKSGQIIVDKHGDYQARDLDEKCLALLEKADRP